MDWFDLVVIGFFVGLFVGVVIGVHWMRWGDAIELKYYQREHPGEFPPYCNKCGRKRE